MLDLPNLRLNHMSNMKTNRSPDTKLSMCTHKFDQLVTKLGNANSMMNTETRFKVF